MNDPMVTEWLFVELLQNNNEFTHLEIFPEVSFDFCMPLAYAYPVSARINFICRSWNRSLNGLSGIWGDIKNKTEKVPLQGNAFLAEMA